MGLGKAICGIGAISEKRLYGATELVMLQMVDPLTTGKNVSFSVKCKVCILNREHF